MTFRPFKSTRGDLPRRAVALVLEWAQEHRFELMEDWGLMQPESAAEEDIAAAIAPAVRPSAPCRVASVEALPGYRLRVRFRDGLEGVVDMSALIASPSAGVFAALADNAAFNRAFVQLGAVCWPGDLDIAPDAIHAAIKSSAKGECVLS